MTAATEEAVEARPAHSTCELADILRAHAPGYARAHSLPSSHRKVIRDITACRTAALGGHLERCDSCGYERPAYNSCRNRHCPKCQCLAKARWLEARRAELLPVGYFHLVFTLPHHLNPLALYNKKPVYDILFHAAARTLTDFGADPRHGLEGRMGFTAILHTWDQPLRYHVHLHCLVPGGALSFDGSEWRNAPDNFLFPVRALSRVFRGKFIEALQEAFAREEILFPGGTDRHAVHSLIRSLWDTEWVVYCKRPFSGPAGVLDYLGRYTHRVAISNHRILSLEDGKVVFTFRDRGDRNRRKTATVEAEEFIRRFLLHVLPHSFMRVRHFGFLSNRSKGKWLPVCRRLLGQPEALPPEQLTTEDLLSRLTGTDITRCPCCGAGTMRVVETLLPQSCARELVCSGIPPPGGTR